jgi:hypothetical protein
MHYHTVVTSQMQGEEADIALFKTVTVSFGMAIEARGN